MTTQRGGLELGRAGIPTYSGDVPLLNEYKQRCLDVLHGRKGQERQIATPVDLRGGTRGPAWEAVKDIPHDELMTFRSVREGKDTKDVATIDGTLLFLERIAKAVQKEEPIRATELFDKVFYAPTVWRQPSEPMHLYLQRREDEFSELSKISGDARICSDIRAWILLRFSGVPRESHHSIVASSGNKFDLESFKSALRMQFGDMHLHRARRPDYHRAPQRPTRSTWAAGEEEPEGGDQVPPPPEPYYEDEAQEEGDEEDHDSEASFHAFAAEEYGVDGSHMGDSDVEVYASAYQARRAAKAHAKGRKGKGRGRGPGKGKDDGVSPQAREERRRRIEALKARSTCLDCHQVGHWRGDFKCPKRREGGGAQKGASSTAVPPKATAPFHRGPPPGRRSRRVPTSPLLMPRRRRRRRLRA